MIFRFVNHIAALIAFTCVIGVTSAIAAELPAQTALTSGWMLQDASKVTGAGGAISTVQYHARSWMRATVPGTVLTSLVNDGIYPEPLYGENNRTIPESLNTTAYWYRTTFTIPKSYAGKHVWLNFNGINYIANVWVNGNNVGTIKGAFSRGMFDITKSARPGVASAVAVEVLPQPHPGTPNEKHIGHGARNGGATALDGPTFLCSIGWDWIPAIRDRDTGIWDSVCLTATGPVTLSNTDVTSELAMPKMRSANLTIQTTLTNHTSTKESGRLVGHFGETKFTQEVALLPNQSRDFVMTPDQIPALHLVNPKLWWPNGYGPQNLYTLHLAFVPKISAVSDSCDTVFGIRQITYSVPGSPNLTVSVNGVPILCKGGDWGMDEALKRISAKRIDAEVRMHKLANTTIIRNWVGQSTSEYLYNACDKYGILLWDEFFQPNPGDGPNPIDDTLYLANVREKILRYRSHPSIAIWCARNEGNPPPVIDAGIKTLMHKLDPNRLYQPSSTSGRGVNSGGPYFWRAPRFYYNFGAAFKTEIGSVSIPTLESIQSMMPKKDWSQINEDWAEHDLTAGASGGDWYPQTLAKRYGPISSLADFARKGQMANYEAFRAMYEGRNAKLFNPVTGVITWMSNPAQPSFVWQLYSWDLEPNASLFGVEKACQPVHIQMNQNNWHVMVINNTPSDLNNYSARMTVYNMNGTVGSSKTTTLNAGRSAATDIGVLTFPINLSPVHFIKLQLINSQGAVVSDNFYWRSTDEDNFAALNTMPMVSLSATASTKSVNGLLTMTVHLKNNSHSPALMAHLQLAHGRNNQRVLPAFYSDNYVSLLPQESKEITIDAAVGDLKGELPVVLVDGWNVTVGQSKLVQPDVNAIVRQSGTQSTVQPTTQPVTSLTSVRINAGGGASGFFTFGTQNSHTNGFLADEFFTGGNTSSVDTPIDVSAANSAPAFVYQSERWGACTYTLPVVKNKRYTVRLHFSENTYATAGKRLFNVDINGTRVLSEFDIFAAAGAKFKAVVKDFNGVTADQKGEITVSFLRGSADEPKISAIEVLPAQ